VVIDLGLDVGTSGLLVKFRDSRGILENLLGDSSSVDEHVELSVVVDDVLNGLTHSLTIAHVNAIEADVDTGLLSEVASGLLAELLLNVHDGDATNTDLSEGLRHVVAETATAAVK
jgi:hypothetical protein